MPYKRPTFDDDTPAAAPAPASKPTAKAAPADPVPQASGGYKRPTFEDDEPKAAADTPADKPKAASKGVVDTILDTVKGMLPDYSADPIAKAKEDLAEQTATNKSLFNGAAFGMGDRIRAYTGIGVDGDNYDERLKNALQERKDYNEQHPGGHYLTEAIPGLLTGAAVTSAAKGALSKVAPIVTDFAAGSGKLPALARAAGNLGTAAGFGALGGAGSAQPGEMADGAKEGAITGMATTLGLQGIGGLAGAAINKLTPMVQKVGIGLGINDPTKWADKKLVESLLEEGHSPESVVAKMKDLANEGTWRPQSPDFVGPPTTVPAKPVIVADALPAKALGMIKKAGTKDGGGAEIINAKLGQRAVEAPDRIANDIATNISDRTGATAEGARLIAERNLKSTPLYEQAKSLGTLPAEDVNPFFDSPFRKHMFKEVQDNRAAFDKPFEGKVTTDPVTGRLKIEQTPSIADLHEMRTDLSKLKQELWNSQEGRYVGKVQVGGVKADAHQLGEELNDLTAHIENLTGGANGPYAKARKIYSDDSSVLDALRSGQNIIKTRPEDVALEFGKLHSDAERDAYRSGISSVLTDKAGSTSSGATILRSIFGNKNIRDKLDQVYPNDGARALFPKQMQAEQQMQATSKVLAPATQQHDFLDSGGSDISLAAAIANGAAHRGVAAAANLAKYISGQADKMTSAYGEQLARLGTMSLPEAQKWAEDVSRRTNGPLAKVGRMVKDSIKAIGHQVPYQAGNLMSRSDEEGPLSRLNKDD